MGNHSIRAAHVVCCGHALGPSDIGVYRVIGSDLQTDAQMVNIPIPTQTVEHFPTPEEVADHIVSSNFRLKLDLTRSTVKCPRPRCRQVIDSCELCCVACFKLLPQSIRADLASKAVHDRPALLDAAKLAALRCLKGLATPSHLLPMDG